MWKWISGVVLAIAVGTAAYISLDRKSPSAASPTITVYKSPTCGCCGKWEEHLRQAGFVVESKPIEAINGIKAQHGIPNALWSCHTGVVDGYVVEGHVPAPSIRKLLATKPAGVKGISVPGMPIGSPGMEGPNPEKYEVLTFNNDGTTAVFDRY